MVLTCCWELSAAEWIILSDVPWQQLACFGVAGFEAYARLRFLPDPVRPGQSENDVEADWRVEQLPTLYAVLSAHTATPEDCYFCVWDGFAQLEAVADGDSGQGAWSTRLSEQGLPPTIGAHPALAPTFHSPSTAPAPPKVVMLHRAYWLFRGALDDVGEWDAARQWPEQIRLDAAPAALVWPADHAWCVARDVDPHWAGIGGNSELIARLTADPRLDVIPADPTATQPAYR